VNVPASARDRGLRRTAVAFLVVYGLARLVAFGRETAIAYLFGVTPDTDAYVAATALPELVAGVLLSGVLGYTIIPEFLRRRAADDPEAATRLLQSALWQTLLVTLGLALAVIALAGPIISLVGPGLGPEEHDRAALMLRLASPAMVLYGLTGVAGAVLNTRNSFLPVPLSFLIGNAVGIAILLAFSSVGIVAAALGYVASAAAFAAIQWALVQRVAPLRLGKPAFRGPEVSAIVRGGLVAIAVTSAPFVRVFFERILGSTASPGDLAELGFVARLVLVVGALVAVSVGTVIFPTMSEQAIRGDRAALARTLRRGVAFVAALSLPFSVAMVAAPDAIVRALFQHGEFSASATTVTSAILRAFAFGLVAICVSEVLLRALFALGAHRRALIVTAASLALNLALDVWLLGELGVEGLGVGASVALWVNAGLLALICAGAIRAGPGPGAVA
jgi:putative peptidoglycan lipid II flippase